MDASIQLPTLSDSQRNMLNLMNERNRERNEKYKIHVLNKFFDVRRVKHPVTLGSFSWSSTPIKTKWLHAAHALNYGGGLETPGDLARDYLYIKYADRRIRCTHDQWISCVADKRQPPLYCEPCKLDDAVYVDISGAFWQIVRAAGWDVNYCPNKFLYSQSRMTDFPHPQNKMARNCLVSVGLPGTMRLWTGTELKFVTRKSKLVNLILWRLVMDVLNSIAYDMVQIGAKYVYTDGYILDAKYSAAAFDVLGDWGIDGRIKSSGSADIVTTACYSFSGAEGFKATENYRRNPNRKGRGINKIYSEVAEWLRPKFSRLANKAQIEWEWINHAEP